MTKRKRKKMGVCHIDGRDATVMPRYNAFQTGHGARADRKHPSRAARKQAGLKEFGCYL